MRTVVAAGISAEAIAALDHGTCELSILKPEADPRSREVVPGWAETLPDDEELRVAYNPVERQKLVNIVAAERWRQRLGARVSEIDVELDTLRNITFKDLTGENEIIGQVIAEDHNPRANRAAAREVVATETPVVEVLPVPEAAARAVDPAHEPGSLAEVLFAELAKLNSTALATTDAEVAEAPATQPPSQEQQPRKWKPEILPVPPTRSIQEMGLFPALTEEELVYFEKLGVALAGKGLEEQLSIVLRNMDDDSAWILLAIKKRDQKEFIRSIQRDGRNLLRIREEYMDSIDDASQAKARRALAAYQKSERLTIQHQLIERRRDQEGVAYKQSRAQRLVETVLRVRQQRLNISATRIGSLSVAGMPGLDFFRI